MLSRSSGELGETTAIIDLRNGVVRMESLGEPRPMPGLRISSSSYGTSDPESLPAAALADSGMKVPDLGPVVVAGQMTVVLAGDALEARSLIDGQVRWRYDLVHGAAAASTMARTHTDPIVAGDMVIIGCLDGQLRAIDLATGNLRWSVDVGSPMGWSGDQMLRCQPVVAAGRIYVTTQGGELACIDTGDRTLGGPRWWGDRN